MVGARVSAARQSMGLGIDDLAARTKIRSSILVAIESDDFTSCGGDVYARGHLKSIAAILEIDPDELLDLFDASAGEP
jgi:cytoskeleton protein RodZ